MSIYVVFKLECLSIKTRLNPTTLRFKLLTTATRSVFEKTAAVAGYACGCVRSVANQEKV